LDHIYELGSFGRGYPGKMESVSFDAHEIHKVLKQQEFPSKIVITFQVMAFPGMSPGHPNAVSPFSESRQSKRRAHPAGTGYPDDPDIRGVFHSVDAGQIGCTVAAPIA
jgi:hypothetical protein